MTERVCGAIIQSEKILMVYHRDDVRAYWTLPGGGVHAGESLEQAVVREVLEETGLNVKVIRPLFDEPDDYEPDAAIHYASIHCFLLQKMDDSQEEILGIDPEEADLAADKRILQGLAWRDLSSMKNDRQVSKVLSTRSLSIGS